MTDADLLDLLENAIADSLDMGWTPNDGALSCLDALRGSARDTRRTGGSVMELADRIETLDGPDSSVHEEIAEDLGAAALRAKETPNG